MSATNLQNFSGDVQIRGTTFIKANTNTNNVAIGTVSGETAQGVNTVAVGVGAGRTSQGTSTVAVGDNAGLTVQGNYSVAIGRVAGQTSQGTFAVAVGTSTGQTSQGTQATAVGYLAGQTEQGAQGTAMGFLAGATKQGADTTAVGRQAGTTSQGASATAVGVYAGMTVQGAQAVAIGRFAGATSQGASAVAVGYLAGQTSQAALSTAVGYAAGFTEQGGSAVAMGRNAGRTSQGAQGVAVGGYAGFSEQATFSVAVGYETGKTSQAGSATAMGYLAGNSEQGQNSVAVGRAAGETSQGAQSVAMGYNAGESEQGTNAVAVGYLAGQTSQGANTTAVGVGAGNSEQGSYSVAVGLNAANVKQGGSAVAIGRDAGKTSQANNSVAVGYFAGYSEQSGQAVAIGIYAGSNKQGAQGVAVGIRAGQVSQGVNTTAVGYVAGQTEQGGSATAVGTSAGTTSQGTSAVAVGNNSGNSEQGTIAVAVGASAGETSQGTQAIAMGFRAGETEQGQFAVAVGTSSGLQAQGSQAVAVGYLAGKTSQGTIAVAVGRQAGQVSQGAAAIAVGYAAGVTAQGANSIILNATGTTFNATTASSFNVKPVRGGNYAASALAYTSGFEIVEETNMHFDTSGNVGIGTAAPQNRLDVRQDITTGSSTTTQLQTQFKIGNASHTQGKALMGYSGRAGPIINAATYWNGASGYYGTVGYYGIAVSNPSASSGDPYGITEGELAAQTRLSITTDGKVGIGTTVPVAALDVLSGSASANALISVRNPASANNNIGAGIQFENYNGSTRTSLGNILALRTAASSNYDSHILIKPTTNGTEVTSMKLFPLEVHLPQNMSGSFQSGADYRASRLTIGDNQYAPLLQSHRYGNYADSHRLEIRGPGNNANSFQEAPKICFGGNAQRGVILNSITPIDGCFTIQTWTGKFKKGNYSWSYGIGSSEFFIYGGSNGSTGVYLPWNATGWNGNSDIRIKKNILPVENGLSKIRKINPVLYHFKTDEDTDNKRIGFIAQEWLEQQPECVSLNPSQDVLGLSMDSTIPVLFTATKELDTKQQEIEATVSNLKDFTGQHRCLIKNISPNDYIKYEGLIVSATNNEYLNHDTTTKPTINEALPIVSLTVKEKDKACLGVISLKADPESNLPDDPTRIKVNSLGEGGIWVINTNGSLESGDYITSSNVSGYGQQQGSEFLTNYTVAKITQNCDFTCKTRKNKKLIKTNKDVIYYTHNDKKLISKAEYDEITDISLRDTKEIPRYEKEEMGAEVEDDEKPYDMIFYRLKEDGSYVSEDEYNKDPSIHTFHKHLKSIEKCTSEEYHKFDEEKKKDFKLCPYVEHYKYIKTETTNYHTAYDIETRQELVNVLDENGQLQWEETDNVYTCYDIRYLSIDGEHTDESNAVHTAAFVGCTYHCG